MSRPILIIRTVSVEKLSTVLDSCRRRWPENPIEVLTSPGREGELSLDGRLSRVIVQTASDGFSSPVHYDGEVEALVIPVANRSGSGYANVLLACRFVRADSRFIASYARELKQVSSVSWSLRWRWETFVGTFSRVIARIWSRRIVRQMRE